MLASRRAVPTISVLVLVLLAVLAPMAQRGPALPSLPGALGQGVTLLPNGWKIAPAGRHLMVGDLPLAMVQSADGRYLIITNNGHARPTLTVVDLKNGYVREKVPVEHAWLGLTWHPDGRRLYSSGASQNTVNEFAYNPAAGRLTAGTAYVLAKPERARGAGETENQGFVGGLAVSPDGRMLYAVHIFGKAVSAVDISRGRVRATIDLDAEPYTCLVSPDGRTLYVSLWGGAKVLMFDAATLAPQGEVPVGPHPNAMAFSRDASRLFVACANTNAVWVVDVASKTAREQISVALYPNAPPGTTPNGLGLSPDGTTLLVANADNNTVAVVDVSKPWASEVEGFIPAGWYPTAAAFDADGKRIFILSGKGLTSAPNPRSNQPMATGADGQYIGAMLQGSLSIVETPDEATLAELTKRVYQLTPYTDARKLAPPEAPKTSSVPRKVGEPSPIKYVFYVIRENRTYDQVFGDMERGNGDPNLALLGEPITPNAHAIAREFVLLDNFYVDAEVSYDGHAWSMGAYATDVVEKIWPTNYGNRGGLYLSEGGWEDRTPFGNIAAPADGYLWDFATRAGVTVRSYGEFVSRDRMTGLMKASVPGLEGLVHPKYPPYDLGIPDQTRADIWLDEFRRYEADGSLPRLSIIRLPNDHTSGTRPGTPTPRAMVADNDLALGRIVEAISHSRYWKECAVFVLEDDAQNGPDHVDAHRSPALVISPFARRQALDSTLYTTSGMLRTMELILGLPPMSQYDAAATPMYNAFQPVPVLTPYVCRPARVPLNERNDASSPGALASLRMNFTEVDMTPEIELNEIIWRSIKGAGSRMPPPVRSAFVRGVEREAEDEKR